MSGKLIYLDRTEEVDCVMCGSRKSPDQLLYGNRVEWSESICQAFELDQEKFLYTFANAFYCWDCNSAVRKLNKILRDESNDYASKYKTDANLQCAKLTLTANIQRIHVAVQSGAHSGPVYAVHQKIRSEVVPAMKGSVKKVKFNNNALIKRVRVTPGEPTEEVIPKINARRRGRRSKTVKKEPVQAEEEWEADGDKSDGKITVVLDVQNDNEGFAKIERIQHLEGMKREDSADDMDTEEAEEQADDDEPMEEGYVEEPEDSEEQWVAPVIVKTDAEEVEDEAENLWLLGMEKETAAADQDDEDFERYKDEYSLKPVTVLVEKIPELVIMVDDEGRIISEEGSGSKQKVVQVARKSTSKPPRLLQEQSMPKSPEKGRPGETYPCTWPDCKMKFLLEIKRDAHIKHFHQGIKKPYECEICNKKFQCYPNYKDHENVHKNELVYQCTLCSRKLHTKAQLKTHLEKHKMAPAKTLCVTCPVVGCTAKFPNDARRDAHVKTQHLGMTRHYPCNQCDRKFKNQKELEDHQNVHQGDRPYKCTQCPESFFMEKRLRIHIQKYHQPPRFECEHCDKKFYIKSQYKYHQRVHTKERPFVCEICDKSFTAPKHLRHHRVSHPELNLPKFQCDMCQKSFSCPASLNVHKKIHTNDYTIACEVCGLGCASQSVLMKHMARHTDERKYSCEFCGATYKTKNCLLKHVRDKHTETGVFPCSICGKELTTRASQARHQALHNDEKPFVCQICGKGFPLQYYLSAHNWKCHKGQPTSRAGRPRKNVSVETPAPPSDIITEEITFTIEEAVPEVETGIEDVVIVTM